MHFVKSLLCFCFLILLISCEKDRDTNAPSVVVIKPIENSYFDVLDPVNLQANLSDDNIIQSVRVSLISSTTMNQVMPSRTIVINQPEYYLDIVFELSDSLLETGSYYFRVEAFDGENYSSGFRTVSIRGIKKRKLGVIVSCKNGLNTDVYSDNNDFSFNYLNSFSGNYLASELNSTDQHFWFVPSNSDVLSALSLKMNSIVYSNRYSSNFTNAFSDLRLDGRDVIVGLTKGEVDGRNQYFSDSYTYLAQSSRKIGKIAVNKTYVLAAESDFSGSNRTISVSRRTSGTLRFSLFFNDQIVDMIFLEEDRCIVLANNAQGGKGVIVDLKMGNVLNTLFTTDSIKSASQTNNGNIFIVTNSSVQFYVFQSGSLTTYLNKPNLIVHYDKFENQLYVGDGNLIKRYTYPSLSTSIVDILPNEVVGINVRYNKN